MPLADTAPINPKFAAALVAFGAFLATHPDLPGLTHIGFRPDGDGVIVYPAHTMERREETTALAAQYTAAWADALGTAPNTPYTYTRPGTEPYACHSAEARITPGVTVYASFLADLEPAETALAAA